MTPNGIAVRCGRGTARAVEIAPGNFFVPFDSIHW